MATDESSETRSADWYKPLALLGWWVAANILLLFYAKSAYPQPSQGEHDLIKLGSAFVFATIGFVVAMLPLYRSQFFKIGCSVLAASTVFLGAYYFDPFRLFVAVPRDVVVSYTVCLGEYERNCGFNHDAYLYCYSDVAAWAKPLCNSASFNAVGSHDGNKCGYTNVQVLCRKSAP